ncbi:uncharacterized protein SRS1_15572 [Sporisorium reilianum f. sp. reilianum]|uniref:Ricin B lectin domain-containing protein n=1 Tax=Sporisorium reilianum f. sp. reilianum TaxID=72559 RepID=A0A2N8UII8_9BASI|nr:uncharacterized protein SRS1_15572 [Sporisorium reilianum f. sp. reilianum]
MAFPRALLLSALLGSAAVTLAAPVFTPCEVNTKQWGSITYEGIPLSLGEDGSVEVGGVPINFAVATCQTTQTDRYDSQSKGYLVNANDPSKCLTASSLDQSDATFSLQECQFNGAQMAGDVYPEQSFAWDFDSNGKLANAYLNGANSNAVNSTQPPLYTIKAQNDRYSFDGSRGKLLVDYTPSLTSLPTPIQIPQNQLPVTATQPPPALECSSHTSGQIIFNNQTSSANQYKGPINGKWEAQADETTKFVFEECDYSAAGPKNDNNAVYGRIRPATDLQDSKFQCYELTSTNYDWVNGVELDGCGYSTFNFADDPDQPLVVPRWNKISDAIEWVIFQNGTQLDHAYAYTQLDFDTEFGVTQYVWDAHGIGFAFVDADNQNLTKYPPGLVTFNADS